MAIISILLKVLLILLTISSFIPQLRRLYLRRDTSGISLTYVVLNLLVATEQLTLGLHLIAADSKDVLPGIIHEPPRLGDWLDLSQFAAVWVCHVVLFLACLRLPPSLFRRKFGMLTAYFSFIFISLALAIYESILLPPRLPPEEDPVWRGREFPAYFGALHMILISPIVTCLGVVSLYFQAQESPSRRSPGALCLLGLSFQAFVFTLVGCSWLFRLRLPTDYHHDVISWYITIGWAAVDNLLFAFVQAALVWIVWRRQEPDGRSDETTGLLRGETL